MDDQNTANSLNLMLGIAAAVLVILGGIWWFMELRDGEALPVDPPVADVPALPPAPAETTESVEAVAAESLDSYLQKAQLAEQADMLIEPAGQNALYFLGLVLGEDPQHPAAIEQLDVVVSRLTVTVDASLAANDFQSLQRVASELGAIRADHPLVESIRNALQQHRDAYVATAIQQAERGEREAALGSLDDARNVPGTNNEQLRATLLEVEDRLDAHAARVAAEARKVESVKAAAVPDWLSDAESALLAGRLIGPGDDNALAYLGRAGDGDTKATEFRARLRAAVLTGIERATGQGEWARAEQLLDAAADLDADPERLETLGVALQRANAQAEARQIIPSSQLVRARWVAPVYPRNAERRGVEGQVDIAFTVTTDGETADIEILDADPAGVFDKAALQAVRQWRFEPHSVRGFVVNQRSAARLRFSLN